MAPGAEEAADVDECLYAALVERYEQLVRRARALPIVETHIQATN